MKPSWDDIPNSVLVFIRAPRIGRVKTRLQQCLAPDAVLELYRSFVRDTLEMLQSGGYAVTVYFHPHHEEALVKKWLGPAYTCRPQAGTDLGEKMAAAFMDSFQMGKKRCVLIGTDSPDLPAAVIDQAFEGLGQKGAVLGPALDGGYYLVGLTPRTFSPGLFEDMSWSAPTVFEQTLRRFKSRNQPVHILPRWRDIDDPAALEAFLAEKGRVETQARRTINCLTALGMAPAR